MIEDMRNRISEIDTHIDKADAELMGVLLSVEIAGTEVSNLDVIKRLKDTLDETLVALSAMATHHQNAQGHLKTAEETVLASGVSIETKLGEKILGAVIRGNNTLTNIDTSDAKLHERLEGLKYRLSGYKSLEEAKVWADDMVRESARSCSNSLQLATDTTTNLKKVL